MIIPYEPPLYIGGMATIYFEKTAEPVKETWQEKVTFLRKRAKKTLKRLKKQMKDAMKTYKERVSK